MITAVQRTVALLEAVDGYGRDGSDDGYSLTGDLLAIRHLAECLIHIVRAHPGVAEMTETYAARAAEAVGLIEEE